MSWVALSWGEVMWLSEWVSEYVSEWMSEGGRKGQREGESEWVWCMGAENYHFVNFRSSLDRVLATHFDWLKVSLAWNFIEYVSADQLSSNIRMFIVYHRRLYKSFYTTYCTIMFLMFVFSTRLQFKWADAKSQIPRRSHAQWCIDVFVNSVIISVIYKFASYSSQKHHDIMILK